MNLIFVLIVESVVVVKFSLFYIIFIYGWGPNFSYACVFNRLAERASDVHVKTIQMDMGLKFQCPFCYKNFAFFHKVMFCAIDHLEMDGEERGKQDTHRHQCSACYCIKRHSRLSEFNEPAKHGCKKQGRPFEVLQIVWTMDDIKRYAVVCSYPEKEVDRLFLEYCTTRKHSRTKLCASRKSRSPPKVKFVFNKQSKTSLKMNSG